MKMVYEFTDEQINELQRFAAANVLQKLKQALRKFSVFDFDDQELMSEIWLTYKRLSENYKSTTNTPILKYLGKYVYQYTIQRFANTIKRQQSEVSFDQFEENEKEMIMNNASNYNNKIKLQKQVTDIIQRMSPADMLIAYDYFYGLTFEQIAQKYKTSVNTIRRRLEKYSELDIGGVDL